MTGRRPCSPPAFLLVTEFDYPFKCYCGEDNCKVLIKGFKYLSNKEKKELKPYLSPFLRKKYSDVLDKDK